MALRPGWPETDERPIGQQSRMVRAVVLLLLGLCIATGAALSDIYLHRGIESAAAEPIVVQPTGRQLATNIDLRLFPTDQIDALAAMLQTNHFTIVRQVFSWSEIEPNKGTFLFDSYDAIVDTLAARGIQLVAVLENSPEWARAAGQTSYADAPAANVDDYAAFVGATVDHYRDRVGFFQLGDRPNQAEKWGGVPAEPNAYYAQLAAGFNAARSAYSEAKVVLAEFDPRYPDGTLGADTDFLRALYQGGAAAFFDVVALRSDGGVSSPYDRKVSDGRLNLSRAILARELMVDYGDGAKPIWLTHYGWNAAVGSGIDDQRAADFAIAGMRRSRAEWPWMGLMFAWDLLPSNEPGANEVGLSLLTETGAARPLFTEMAAFGATGITSIAATGFVPMESEPVSYEGGWEAQHLLRRTFRTTSETGASATLRFRGTGVTAILRVSRQAGQVGVTMDGKPISGYPIQNGQSIVNLDFFQAQDVPVQLVENVQDTDHELRLTLLDKGQLTLGGLIVSRDPPLLWPVILLVVIAGAMVFAGLREAVLVVAVAGGYLTQAEDSELVPPLPRMPDWRPAPRYR